MSRMLEYYQTCIRYRGARPKRSRLGPVIHLKLPSHTNTEVYTLGKYCWNKIPKYIDSRKCLQRVGPGRQGTMNRSMIRGLKAHMKDSVLVDDNGHYWLAHLPRKSLLPIPPPPEIVMSPPKLLRSPPPTKRKKHGSGDSGIIEGGGPGQEAEPDVVREMAKMVIREDEMKASNSAGQLAGQIQQALTGRRVPIYEKARLSFQAPAKEGTTKELQELVKVIGESETEKGRKLTEKLCNSLPFGTKTGFRPQVYGTSFSFKVNRNSK